MDIEAYRIRTKKTVAELAELLGVKPAAIYNYKYGKSMPSYEAIEKMLLDGAYLSEIFNEKVQNKVFESCGVECNEFQKPIIQNQNLYETPEFKIAVAKAIKQLKEMGKV